MSELIQQALRSRLVDLAQPWHPGMPHWPTHPPFAYTLTKTHGEFMFGDSASSAADSIALGSHTGTHIDALCHFSSSGLLHGGVDASTVQDYLTGVHHHSIDTISPIVRRGILLDIAALEGLDALPEDLTITPAALEAAESAAGVTIVTGDVVLLRTGWGRFWHDPKRFINGLRQPGPALDAARWLSARRVFAAASDTAAFEKVPSPEMAVHVHLLVETGIHILECLNLEELAQVRPQEFLFLAAPLKIRGATGSPLRPFALIPP